MDNHFNTAAHPIVFICISSTFNPSWRQSLVTSTDYSLGRFILSLERSPIAVNHICFTSLFLQLLSVRAMIGRACMSIKTSSWQVGILDS